MKFNLTIEEFTLLQNAIHYYKHIPKRGEFQKYNIDYCEKLRDKLAPPVALHAGTEYLLVELSKILFPKMENTISQIKFYMEYLGH